MLSNNFYCFLVFPDKLAALLDSRKAERLADKILSLAEDLKAIHRSRNENRKRPHDDRDDKDSKKIKKEKEKEKVPEVEPNMMDMPSDQEAKPSPGQLSAMQVQFHDFESTYQYI